jgi:cytidylate kinase
MACSVVCISGAMGAGGAEAATIAAERLGFRVIDEEILVRAAALAGVDPHVVADVEQRRSLLGRLLQGVSSAADASALTFGGLALPPDEAPATDDLRGLIRTAIQEAADEIAFSDRARADYFKRFYRVPAELPTHYDLVVCTDRLTAAAAADLIVAAAGA